MTTFGIPFGNSRHDPRPKHNACCKTVCRCSQSEPFSSERDQISEMYILWVASLVLALSFSFQVGGFVATRTLSSKNRNTHLYVVANGDELSGAYAPPSLDERAEREKERTALKKNLFQIGASYDRGFGASPSARRRADDIIQNLERLNEETDAARGIDGDSVSPLAGSWRMIWTTASDVLVLGASPVAQVGAIYQVFTPPEVTNIIDFIPRAQSLLPSVIPSSMIRAKVRTRASSRKESENRIGLLFEAVKLQPVEFLGLDASTLPPFAANLPKIPGTDSNDSGPGYFDVTYLDEELLIIRQNAPGGLFALAKVDDSEP